MSKNDTLNRCTRRSVLATMAGLPVAAAMARQTGSQRERRSGAGGGTVETPPKPLRIADLHGRPPLAQIGKVKISRLILGGNQIADYNHCRKFPYVNQVISAYYTREKIASALSLAEQCGINSILTNPTFIPKLQDYWKNFNGRIQFISDCGGPPDLLTSVQSSIDAGAAACYIHGGISDRLVKAGDFDQMSKALELIRKNGLPGGIGAHQLETVQGAVGKGLRPDFWMKTIHPLSWGKSKLVSGYDEISCGNATGEWNGSEVMAFMKDLKEPWIAFKTMAVGAVPPADAFKYAFDHGADFVCAGMFEWQLVGDVNIAMAAIKGAKRERPWRALCPEA